MGEVDHPEDPVDEAVPEGNHRVDRALRDALDQEIAPRGARVASLRSAQGEGLPRSHPDDQKDRDPEDDEDDPSPWQPLEASHPDPGHACGARAGHARPPLTEATAGEPGGSPAAAGFLRSFCSEHLVERLRVAVHRWLIGAAFNRPPRRPVDRDRDVGGAVAGPPRAWKFCTKAATSPCACGLSSAIVAPALAPSLASVSSGTVAPSIRW